jgi:hypothetical protein
MEKKKKEKEKDNLQRKSYKVTPFTHCFRIFISEKVIFKKSNEICTDVLHSSD